jgi:hypothetical protein
MQRTGVTNVDVDSALVERPDQRGSEKKELVVDTSGIEPDTFRKAAKVRSERDKPTTPCAPIHL